VYELFVPPLRKILPAPVAFVSLLALVGCESVTVVTLEVDRIDVTPEELSLAEGETAAFVAVPRSASGDPLSGREVDWTVDAPEVAAVDAGGNVEALREGSTTVRARAEGVEGTASLTVLPGPSIGLDPEAVTLSALAGDGSPAEASVEVTNTAFGTLSGLQVQVRGEGDDEALWLSAELSGTTAPALVAIRASTAGLEPGTYRAWIEVGSPVARDGPAEIEVTFQVEEPPPVIGVDPTSVGLSAVSGSGTAASQTVSVTNLGGGTLSGLSTSVEYADGQPTGWLSGVLGGSTAPTSLSVRASARDLPPGQYSGWVRVSSPLAENESVSVSVSFTVRDR
jgi:hypothetical protein